MDPHYSARWGKRREEKKKKSARQLANDRASPARSASFDGTVSAPKEEKKKKGKKGKSEG